MSKWCYVEMVLRRNRDHGRSVGIVLRRNGDQCLFVRMVTVVNLSEWCYVGVVLRRNSDHDRFVGLALRRNGDLPPLLAPET